MQKLKYPDLIDVYKGLCPICSREMYDINSSIDRHHLVPKCKGGVATEFMHRVCHTKIHSLFTEKECATTYSTVNSILENEDIQKFVEWISKKDPLFKAKNITSTAKKKR